MSTRYIDDTREILGAAFDGKVSGEYFKVIEAMHVCLVAHHGQYRKHNQVMYALHPFRVFLFARSVLDIRDPDVLCACLLHDTVEDGGVALDDLKKQFGERVAGFVAELTRQPCDDRAQKKQELLQHAREFSNESRTIKAVDRIDNLADAFVNFGDKKIWEYTSESIELYYALKAGLRINDLMPCVSDALEYLRCTINETILAVRSKRKIPEFDTFTLIS